MSEQEKKELQNIISQIDYLYQEGVIFSESDIKLLDKCGHFLTNLAYNLSNK